MRTLVVELAEQRCPTLSSALGPEAFRSTLGAALDQWVLSLFVGCVPHRLLDHLWDWLLLAPSSPDQQRLVEASGRPPRGLAALIAFALAALKCCGEDVLQDSDVVKQLMAMRQAGAQAESLSMEASEAIQSIRKNLLTWPAEQDRLMLSSAAAILAELAGEGGDGLVRLWEEVRRRKQRIAASVDDYDEQLMLLAQRTHFSMAELERLRAELERVRRARNSLPPSPGLDGSTGSGGDAGLSLAGFTQVVQRAVPDFPPELCGRLFAKLDAFGVGRLAFAELACGMSALSLGTMDEKLQVCFDLFDSEGQRALTLKDLTDLCTVLFRVALAQGLHSTKKACTDEVLEQSRKAVEDGPKGPPRHTMPVYSKTSVTWSEIMDDSAEAAPDLPWRNMLLKLLAATHVRVPGGPRVVDFEDFRRAAMMEPALLVLFSWCAPLEDGSTPIPVSQTFVCGQEATSSASGTCRACRFLASLCGR